MAKTGFLGAGVIALAATFAMAGAGSADSGPKKKPLTPKAAQAVENARSYKAPAPGLSGSRVAKDPVTGEFREPVAGELPDAATGGSGRATKVVVQPDSSVRAYLGDEFLTDMVAVRNADGTISMKCAHGDAPQTRDHQHRAEVK